MKCNQAQYLHRVQIIEKKLLDGEPRADILDFAMRTYSVSEAMVGYYITDAYKRITAINKATIDENRGWILRNLIEVYREARREQDRANSLKALKQIAEVTGVEIAPAQQSPIAEGLALEDVKKAWDEAEVMN